jgi:hypothetical protein
MGDTTSSTGDRVEVDSVLSASELAQISIGEMPVRQVNGQIVLAP